MYVEKSFQKVLAIIVVFLFNHSDSLGSCDGFDRVWNAQLIESEIKAAENFLRSIDTENTVVVYGSARFSPGHPMYEEAKKLGRLLAELGLGVATGGGPGVMRAANEGALEAGGRSYAVSILIPHEIAQNNAVQNRIIFSQYFIRREALRRAGRDRVIFEGGLGTMDELTDVLVLAQNGFSDREPVPILMPRLQQSLDLLGARLSQTGMISPNDLSLLRPVATAEEALAVILENRARRSAPALAR